MECPKCKGEMELGIYQTEELDYDRVVSCTNKQCDFEYSITEFFDIYTDLAEINEGLKAKVNELEVEMKWKEEVAENWFDKCNKAENKVIELESIMTDVKRELQDILENKGSE